MIPSFSRVAIVCSGELEFTQKELSSCFEDLNCIIAADGGLHRLSAVNMLPDVVIGDLDSVSPADFSAAEGIQWVKIENQDKCDLEKALDFAQEQKASEVLLFGLAGKRPDYAIANFCLLYSYGKKMRLKVLGKGWQAFPIYSKVSLDLEPGTQMSLIPFGECEGVMLKGFRYALDESRFKLGQVGVSNEVVDSQASISIQSGYMICFVFQEKSERDER